MDRSVLESDPHRVLEGMAIAGYAVGASQGYVYCRAEYPLAVARLKTAIRQAGRAGLLGAGIADTAVRVPGRAAHRRRGVRVRRGDGADRLGRGRPRHAPAAAAVPGRGGPVGQADADQQRRDVRQHRPDHPQRRRLVRRHRHRRRARAPRCSRWPGEVVNTGLVEVPMGITLREIVYDIGGGIVDGRPFKAVQTGGPSGGCIPGQYLDMPVDYESLTEVGSIMGSGGMIVMDDSACMVDVARYFMDFCRDESCGKCIPCRVGTTQLHTPARPASRRRRHPGRPGPARGAVGHGQAHQPVRPRPERPQPGVLDTLRYFRDEYLAHIQDRTCPAGRPCQRSPTARRRADERPHPAIDGTTWPAPPASRSWRSRPRTASTSRPCATWTASATSAPAGCAWSRSAGRASSCRPA